MSQRISQEKNAAKPQHSTAFLKSLSSLTKSKPKVVASSPSKDANSSSQEESRATYKQQETPRKTRAKDKSFLGSSESSDDMQDSPSSSSHEISSNIQIHLKAQQISKPKLFMPQQSAILAQSKVKQMRVVEIQEQTIPSFEVLGQVELVTQTNIIHQILIKDQKFKPEQLRIMQGDTVEWKLCTDSNPSSDDYSLYYERSRSHVISFDQVMFESPLLRISNRGVADPSKTTFRITFREAGTFEFVCRIYTWMKGKVEVISSGQDSNIQIEPDTTLPLLQAAINSEKTQVKKVKKSPVIDFKEVFGQFGDKMRPEDIVQSCSDEELPSEISQKPTQDLQIDQKQIELEEQRFLDEQRQSKRTPAVVRNSSGSVENPTSDEQLPSSSRRRDVELIGKLSPPKEQLLFNKQISVTDDERKYDGGRLRHLQPNSQRKDAPPPRLNQYSLLFHSSSTTSATREHSQTHKNYQNPRLISNFMEQFQEQPREYIFKNVADDYQENQMHYKQHSQHIDTSSQFSQSLDQESETSSSAMEGLSEMNQSMLGPNIYRYSKNPYAHLATASWQPFTNSELRQIFQVPGYTNDDEYIRNQQKLQTQCRKKLKKKQYQKRKDQQKNQLALPCDFDIWLMNIFQFQRQNNNNRQIDVYQDDFEDVQVTGSPESNNNMLEGLRFPMCGLHAMAVSERDQFHIQTAQDRIRTVFDQGMRGALFF